MPSDLWKRPDTPGRAACNKSVPSLSPCFLGYTSRLGAPGCPQQATVVTPFASQAPRSVHRTLYQYCYVGVLVPIHRSRNLVVPTRHGLWRVPATGSASSCATPFVLQRPNLTITYKTRGIRRVRCVRIWIACLSSTEHGR